MSEFRGRGRGMRGGRGRGGPPRGAMRGGRGGFNDRDSGRGSSRGRGGFPRSRGGLIRHISRDDEGSPPPPRKAPMMSRGYDSDRGRGPPMSRRMDRYDDSYDRGPPPRSRDSYPSPPRESTRLLDRLTPPRSSLRDRDYGLGSARDYPSSRGDYLPPPRSYSPPPRDSGFSSRDSFREERRDSFSRPAPRDYGAPRLSNDYGGERSSRDFRESPRDYGSSRDYPSSRSEFRDSMSGRAEYRERLSARDYEHERDHHPRSFDRPERDYGSSRFSSRMDDRPHRGPPREYTGRGGPRGSMRGRDDRGGRFMNGGRGRGPPRGRGRPDFAGSRGRRSPPTGGRDGPPRKAPRMDGGDGYSSRR